MIINIRGRYFKLDVLRPIITYLVSMFRTVSRPPKLLVNIQIISVNINIAQLRIISEA